MTEGFWLYILASGRHGTLYVGVTNDLARRMLEHREGLLPGFTRRYGVTRLVYAESFASVADAIDTERRIKLWGRAWKIALIERDNPTWRDLYLEMNF
jgi:putative endonuclease